MIDGKKEFVVELFITINSIMCLDWDDHQRLLEEQKLYDLLLEEYHCWQK